MVAIGFFMNAVVARTVSHLLLAQPVAVFIKQHVSATIDDCCLTQLYADTGKVDNKAAPLPASRPFSDETERSVSTCKRESSNPRENKTNKHPSIINVTSKRSPIKLTNKLTSDRSTTKTLQRTSQDGRKDFKSRCNVTGVCARPHIYHHCPIRPGASAR